MKFTIWSVIFLNSNRTEADSSIFEYSWSHSQDQRVRPDQLCEGEDALFGEVQEQQPLFGWLTIQWGSGGS